MPSDGNLNPPPLPTSPPPRAERSKTNLDLPVLLLPLRLGGEGRGEVGMKPLRAMTLIARRIVLFLSASAERNTNLAQPVSLHSIYLRNTSKDSPCRES